MTYLVSAATTGTASHDAIPCGWDCGNGYAKLHSPDGEILIPSYFYQIDDHDCISYESLGNGSLIEYLSGDRLDLINTRWPGQTHLKKVQQILTKININVLEESRAYLSSKSK